MEAHIPAFATIRKRPDFLAVRGGQRASAAPFLIETRKRADTAITGQEARFGFTVTKKLGNAVTRNRIRRRLKAAVAEVAEHLAQPGFDYVIVARPAAFDRPYPALVADLEKTLTALHRTRGAGASERGPKSTRLA